MTAVHPDSEAILHPTGLSISARPLSEYPWLRHASTTRNFSSPDSPKSADLAKIREHLDASGTFLVFGEQKHTDNIAVVSGDVIAANLESCYYRYPQTDALVCPLANVTLAIMTADCAPVFLVDPQQRIIALVHAGWKGTFARIAAKTVEKMISIGSEPANIVSWVGPMAGGCCYEVSEEMIEKFRDEFASLPADAIHQGRKLDLVALNCFQLEMAGLSPSNVHRSNLCTIHHSDRFYSYRADNGTHGRIISAMVMLQDA